MKDKTSESGKRGKTMEALREKQGSALKTEKTDAAPWPLAKLG